MEYLKYETGQVIAGARTVFAWRIILRDGKSSIQPITGTSPRKTFGEAAIVSA